MWKVNDNNIPLFRYIENDFHFVLTKNNKVDSVFDSLVIKKWKEAEENGAIKHTLNITREKMLEGKYSFLVQLHPRRQKNKRVVKDITSMSQPFDPSLFNFTKLSKKEIIIDVGNGDGNDIVAANICPFENYHSLLITERFKCYPQLVTKYSLKKAVHLQLLSNSPYLRITFHSLCGYATVNHLHWHLYYLKHHMLLESIKVDHLRGPLFVLTDFPSKGFCLKFSSFSDRNIDDFVSWTYFIVEYLQSSSIPYNICITRAKDNFESNSYDDIRIYIWAMKYSASIKNTYDFDAAACALFGHVQSKNGDGYERLTEDRVAEILNDITSDNFYRVKVNISKMNLDTK